MASETYDVRRRVIPTDGTVEAANRWFASRGLRVRADASWVLLECSDDADFRPSEAVLEVLVPSPGVQEGLTLRVDVDAAVHTTLPMMENAIEGGVPRVLVAAASLTEGPDGWSARTPTPELGPLLFETTEPKLLANQIDLVRDLASGSHVLFAGQPGAPLWIGAAGFSHRLSVWAPARAEIASTFSESVGPALNVGRLLRFGDHAVAHAGEAGMTVTMLGRDASVFLPRSRPGDFRPHLRPDHFDTQAPGAVRALRIDRPAGLDAATIRPLGEAREARDVTLRVDDEGSLTLSANAPGRDPVVVPGPGFLTLNGIRNQDFLVPRFVALALDRCSRLGSVDIAMDATVGRLMVPDVGLVATWDVG